VHVLRLPVNILNLWLWPDSSGVGGDLTPPHKILGCGKRSWDLWGFLKLVINFRVSKNGGNFWTG